MIKSIFSYLFFFVYYFIFSVILVKKMIKKKKIIEPIFIAKLTIRNYPSKTEILEIIDIYISSSDLKKDYEVEEKPNSMILTFKDTTIANLDLKISYGMSNVFANIYIYAILNALVPMLISADGVDVNNRNYNIDNEFKDNYFYVYLKGIFELRG